MSLEEPVTPKSPTDVVREHRELFETIAGLDEIDEEFEAFAERFGQQPLAAVDEEDDE